MKNILKLIKKNKSLKTNATFALIANIVYAVSQWLIIAYLAKSGATEKLGIYTLAIAVISPVFLFFGMNLRSVQVTDAKEENTFQEFFGLKVITAFFAIIMSFLLLPLFFDDIRVVLVYILIVILKTFEMFSELFHGEKQRKEHIILISISTIIKSIFYFATFIFVYNITLSISTALLFSVLTSCIIISIIDFYYLGRGIKKVPVFHKNALIKLIKVSLPMAFVLALLSIYTHIPRYFIEFFADRKVLGFFSAVSYVALIGAMLINAVSQTVSPRLSYYLKEKMLDKYIKLMLKMQIIAFVVSIIGVFIAFSFGQRLLILIYGNEYAKFYNVFFLLTIGYSINYLASMVGTGITSARMFKEEMYVNIITVACEVLICFILLYKMSSLNILNIVCYAVIISSLIKYFCYIFYFNRFISERRNG